jgi:hypothetical protein
MTFPFSRAFDFARDNPESSVLKYAIARLRSLVINPSNWELFQNLILQCLTIEPGTLPYALEQFIRFSNMGFSIATAKLEEILNAQIQYHAPLGHGSEAAWSLWGAMVFNIPLDKITGDSVAKMDDSVVALLALHAEQLGLFSSPLDKSNWLQYMTQDALNEEQWLLSYEANVKGWMPSLGATDHVLSDPCFGYLKKNAVNFYDTSMIAKVTPTATLPIPGGDFYQ